MSFLFFLLKNLTMQQVYGSWYLQDGFKLGLFEAALIAFVFVILFYYVFTMPKISLTLGSMTIGKWFLMGIINAVVTMAVTFLTGRSLLLKYIAANGLETYQPGCSQLVTSAGAIDLWLFATNSVILGVIIFFLLSVILKRWSNISVIPFGKKHENRKIKK